VIPPFDPFERLPRALHPLAHAPLGPGWNHSELADLLPPEASLRPAAVLVALIDRADGPRVLLTRRTEALRHHAGQISFPGGSIDAGDADPVAAALREADEEVGLGAGLSLPLGYLDPFVTITGFHVFPVVATVSREYVPRLDPSEVAEAFEVPLAFLLDPRNVHELEVDWQGRRRRLLEYRYEGHRIWGATAAMLVNFRHRLENAP
jgi:8-oxo-dGTP pyrophosphatase MutT (NUDIX family)